MNPRHLALRIAVIVAGTALAYVLGRAAATASPLVKLVGASAYATAFAYLQIWLGAQSLRAALRRLGQSTLLQLRRETALGALPAWRVPAHHALLFASTLLVGVGFATKNLWALGAAAVGWWLADDLLLADARRRLVAATPLPLMNRLPADFDMDAATESIKGIGPTDPLIAARVGAVAVHAEVTRWLKDNGMADSGPPLLCAVGALAGQACQQRLRAIARSRGVPEDAFFVKVQTTQGETLMFGDPLNDLLTKGEHSLWHLAGEAARYVGARELPPLDPMFAHVAATAGSDTFGVPRELKAARPEALPRHLLAGLWPRLLPLLEAFDEEAGGRQLALNVAAQTAIERSARQVRGGQALSLLMESAIAMSKVTLAPP